MGLSLGARSVLGFAWREGSAARDGSQGKPGENVGMGRESLGETMPLGTCL